MHLIKILFLLCSAFCLVDHKVVVEPIFLGFSLSLNLLIFTCKVTFSQTLLLSSQNSYELNFMSSDHIHLP